MHRTHGLALVVLLALTLTAPPLRAQPGIGTCVMGETRTTTGGQAGLTGFGLVVYEWFDPSTCGFCLVSDGAIQLRTVETQAFYGPTFGQPPMPALDVPVRISIVGWQGTTACPTPDDAQVLLAPQAAVIQLPASTIEQLYTVRTPIVGSPLFTTPAFLRLEFLPAGTSTTSPGFGQVIRPSCPTCQQYLLSPFLVGLVEACSPGSISPFAVRPRGDCVAVTPVRRATWGAVKSFYK